MNLIRAFIAIQLPSELRQAISTHSAGLQKNTGAAVRWVTPGNLHLTLKFLGDVSPSNLELLRQAMTQEAASASPFRLEAGGLGAFPSLHRPRVIWLGLQAPAELLRLQHSLDAATARVGYPGDEKPFSPHLTIGRVRDSISPAEQQKLRQGLETVSIPSLGGFEVKDIHLMRSDLQPGGAVYTHLFTARLGA